MACYVNANWPGIVQRASSIGTVHYALESYSCAQGSYSVPRYNTLCSDILHDGLLDTWKGREGRTMEGRRDGGLLDCVSRELGVCLFVWCVVIH